jgi:ribonuclease P protein subunit POP4
MRNRTNLHKHELVGLPCRVVHASDGGMVGMEGKVIDETRETLIFEGERTVPKRGTSFEFTLPDGEAVVLDGSGLAFRPEDRVKRATANVRKEGRQPR